VRRARQPALAPLIACLFGKHHGSYGSPRIIADLKDLDWRLSKNTVAKLMAVHRSGPANAWWRRSSNGFEHVRGNSDLCSAPAPDVSL
jgi:hypothetical protein